MIRLFDFLFSFFGILFLLPVMLVLYIIGLFDTGSPVFKQQRVGKNKKPFTLYKFRTMNVKAKSVATHLADGSQITKFGGFLRKSKLDELPQLFNVLFGDMSLVGPRPNLFNQTELIKERDSRGVYNVVPGITRLATSNAIDMSNPTELAIKDAEMIKSSTITDCIKYIFTTVGGKGQGERVVK